ncbi:nitrogen fixation protein NifZ [Methylomagnum ishizawai]|uniref:Nitrogen fixation protein NifZ n=1 Tax=Methylomagnum ishizawai TaxID=1760988 RepID=A0A1Y6DDI4_9GAMM|nr:nitrogen fixation protein NifZ [Methylomagnum ishizawai]SMF97555.1 nitrogen fixation protein NifZ [Methylomagnum ishizawai]
MIELREPIYQWGQKVRIEEALYNDGSYPDCEPEGLLVEAGTEGEIVQIGHHEEANIPIYMVEFPNGRVVGCFEEELSAEHATVQVAGLL